ncbi:condensation domain-containing protein [Micromonosporaceae bacterium B7E4]
MIYTDPDFEAEGPVAPVSLPSTASRLPRHRTERLGYASLADQPPEFPLPARVPLLPLQEEALRAVSGVPVLGLVFTPAVLLRPELLEQAVRAVVARHDGLRLRLGSDDGGWHQYVVAEETAEIFETIDLVPGLGAGLVGTLREHAERLRQDLDLIDGPLIRIAYLTGDSVAQARLLVVVSHFGFDAISWLVFMDDLAQTYRQLAFGEIVEPSATASILGVARSVREHAMGSAGVAEGAFWAGVAERFLPEDHVGVQPVLADRTETFVVGLDRASAEALRRASAVRGDLGMVEILLGSLAAASTRCGGNTLFKVQYTYHGRDGGVGGYDVLDAIGWVATQVPMILDLSVVTSAHDAVNLARDQLRQMPNRGTGYLALHQTMTGSRGSLVRAVRDNVDITVNFMRSAKNPQPSLFEVTSPQPNLFDFPTRHPRSLAIRSTDDLSGSLTFGWNFDPVLRNRHTVARTARAHIEALREIAAQYT